jgi:hypothetical protein
MDIAATDIVKAVVSFGFGEIASIAAQRAIDQDVIATIAQAHGDASFAETIRGGVKAYRRIRRVALDALYALRPYYTNGFILDAVRNAQERPGVNPTATVVQLDADRYRTNNAALLLDIWTLLNCGRCVSDAFFAELQRSQADLEEPGDFLDLFNACINEACLKDGVDELRLCMERIAVALHTLTTQDALVSSKHKHKRKRAVSQQSTTNKV